MTNKSIYRSDISYCTGNNRNFDHNLKANGRIDFDAPPEGYRYTALPIDYSTVQEWHLDPMFVTRHKIGTKRMLCYMELVKTKTSLKYEQTYKTENTKETRRRRCRIISEKTGNEIMCPYDGKHVCAGCEKAGDYNRHNSVPLSLDALFTTEEGESTLDIAAPENTAADAENHAAREQVFAKLAELDNQKRQKNQRAMHVRIYQLWIEGRTFMDICRILQISKSGLHDDFLRIAKIIQSEIE